MRRERDSACKLFEVPYLFPSPLLFPPRTCVCVHVCVCVCACVCVCVLLSQVRTRDLGGYCTTGDFVHAVVDNLRFRPRH